MSFAKGAAFDQDKRRSLLGGKGAGLARMVDLGLPVPPGFTLTTESCKIHLAEGWKPALEAALVGCLNDLENDTGKRLGDRCRPLLVSVRSGAPISMPGMMDTVLNAGMTADIAQSLGEASGDARFGWDTLRRFVQSYVSVVLGAPAEFVRGVIEEQLGHDEGASMAPDELGRVTRALSGIFADRGYPIPADPLTQIREAVGAVFTSWNCDRAKTYRHLEGISDDLFTAANVQMMAFGNLGDQSGTGVAFSRNPSDGSPGLMGDFLQSAQGEDVVAGTHQTLPISALRDLWPDMYAELERTAHLLEHDLRDLVDIEFTVESGKFWMLQYRRGKHSPRAALRMAIDMAEDPKFPLTREEALKRVEKILQDPPMLPVVQFNSADIRVLAKGLAASPGQAIGALCTSVDEAVAAQGRGEAVILARRETSPSDIAGMAASVGILTTRGGHVSHAAVVARGWGLPAVVGAQDIEVLDEGIKIEGKLIPNGTEITVDGSSGLVLLGAHGRTEAEAPEVAILRAWSREGSSGTASAQAAGYKESATLETVSRALAIKGMGDPAGIADVLGTAVDEVAAIFATLIEAGDLKTMSNNRVRVTPKLTQRVDEWFAAAADRVKNGIIKEWDEFHVVNDHFKELVSRWQMREVDGTQVLNDHSDEAYDAEVLGSVRPKIHTLIMPIIERVAQAEPRLIRYRDRLTHALSALEAGDSSMLAHPLKNSYHTVWFGLHEELIRLSGRKRVE
jgi:pyruvate,orthophosphate dikinase